MRYGDGAGSGQQEPVGVGPLSSRSVAKLSTNGMQVRLSCILEFMNLLG